ncbi:unnamed protein product [Medioppia subpectinata]|uniref:Triokinase/FMN cyclase n=1 Tax=Medioppia subpectinata TaxID=1979941 RepID=A0A7R9L3S7_9ACAR|nr:unnamed protein product [Medioppia subpectinata]CAG2113852.1 unnamed protein product [Medioppia subpectinata]
MYNVSDCLLGLALTNDGLIMIPKCNSIVRKDYHEYRKSGNVMLISGANSPMFAGFVGTGLLTGVVSGEIFASPPSRMAYKLIETIADQDLDNEILIIVANYTGDRLNFGLALEHALLKEYKVDMFVFGDDVAFYGKPKSAGRRGLAGIAFVHKIAGALADEGYTSHKIKSNLEQYGAQIGTISISLNYAKKPSTAALPSIKSKLAADTFVLGMGVHGEDGVEKVKMCSAHDMVDIMLEQLVGRKSLLNDSIHRHNNRVAIIINNTGGLSIFELNIIAKETAHQLRDRNIRVERLYVGSFMTSFSMAGVSLSALAVDDRLLELLDRPSVSSAWTQALNAPQIVNPCAELADRALSQSTETTDYDAIDGLPFGRQLFVRAVQLSCERLITSENINHLNDLDTDVGDGDCGSTLSNAANHFLAIIQTQQLKPSFFQMSHMCEYNMGGASGALYSLLFTAASQAIRSNVRKIDQSYDCINLWKDVLKYCLQTITQYSSAKPGDRSMLDPLYSAYQILGKCDHTLKYHEIAKLVAQGAKDGADSTASMVANVGRASYSPSVRKPDAGAVGVAIWMDAIAEAFRECYGNKH